MPGLDHKGPMGQGPGTGRKQGNCVPEKDNSNEKGGFFGFGKGKGRGLGRKRGFGRSKQGTGRGFSFGLGLGRGRQEE